MDKIQHGFDNNVLGPERSRYNIAVVQKWICFLQCEVARNEQQEHLYRPSLVRLELENTEEQKSTPRLNIHFPAKRPVGVFGGVCTAVGA